jgi:hypothetical protein
VIDILFVSQPGGGVGSDSSSQATAPASSGASFSGDARADLVARWGDTFRIWHSETGAGNAFPWGVDYYAGSGWAGKDANAIYFPDMNGDGKKDLVLLEGDSFRVWHNVRGQIREAFPWGAEFKVGAGWAGADPSAIYFPDMNGDGKADLVYQSGDSFRVWHNLHGATWGAFPWGEEFSVGAGWASVDPSAIYFPDMTGDRKADLVARFGDQFRIWHNTAGQTWGIYPWGPEFNAGAGWASADPNTIYFPDMNGDRKADLVYQSGDGFRVWHNLHGQTWNVFPWGPEFTVGAGWSTADPSSIYFP